MNKNNLINPLLPSKQKEIHTWGFFSLSACSLLIAILLFVSGKQLIIIWKLKKSLRIAMMQTAQLKQIDVEISIAETNNEQLIKKLNKVILYRKQAAKIARFLHELALHTPKDLVLKKLVLEDNKNIVLEGQALSPQSINNFIEQLDTDPWIQDIIVDSLYQQHTSPDSLHFAMHATLKKNVINKN